MLSQTVEYALRSIVYLADQNGEPRTTAQTADTTYVPVDDLAKVMQSLSRANLVNSQRGLHGGFTLAYDPEELSALTVINAVDPIRRYPKCPLGDVSHSRRLCLLLSRLDEATSLFEEVFSQTQVADLLSGPRRKRAVCRFPGALKIVS